MQNVLKQFGAKVTGSLNGQFHSARVRLTFIYVALLAIILFISSFIIFSSFSQRLQRRFRSTPPRIEFRRSPQSEFRELAPMPTPEQVKADLIETLAMVNGFLLVCAGLLSYWLAGRTLEPIQAIYENQRRFLSDASHELRTPLAILRTELENELGNTGMKKKEKEQAESHLEEVERMTHLVNDLLAISRLDSTSLKEHITAVDLSELITLVIDRLAGYAKKQDITLLTLLPKEKIVIQADREQIIQAVSNLAKNAIDYNKPKGKVTVSLKQQNNAASITVSDTGIGIAHTELAKLFDRFYRVDKSRTRISGGNGLGLAIVKAVAEKHGGSIVIRSTPDKGTTATLTLSLS